MTDKYNDIIFMPHHQSKVHPKMEMANRAAQFAPFAALTGFDEQINETVRLTNKKLGLSEEELAKINDKLNELHKHEQEHPSITVIYFKADKKKTGGAYLTFAGRIRQVDSVHKELVFMPDKKIAFDDIFQIF